MKQGERELRGAVDVARALVWKAALEAGRYWLAKEASDGDLDDGDYARLETLAERVKDFDAAWKALEALLVDAPIEHDGGRK